MDADRVPAMDADDRVVELSEDGWVLAHEIDNEPVMPATTRDDTDAGWGESRWDNDARLMADRPPHWE